MRQKQQRTKCVPNGHMRNLQQRHVQKALLEDNRIQTRTGARREGKTSGGEMPLLPKCSEGAAYRIVRFRFWGGRSLPAPGRMEKAARRKRQPTR